MIASGICTGAMLFMTIFLYKEPKRETEEKQNLSETLKGIFSKIAIVFMDWRFILFIFIYSWFWILYFQMFGTVLWYFRAFVDPAPLNSFIQSFGVNFSFDVEHVTVINAFAIISLQLLVSSIVKNTKPLPTMVAGILIATTGMAILSTSTSIWVFMQVYSYSRWAK